MRMLFGEQLGRVVRISSHDVSEILEDQSVSKRRFGEIALSLGLCQPQHVWQAWSTQLSDGPPTVDLGAVGVDAQAVAHLPRHIAIRYRVIPLRTLSDEMVVAADAATVNWAAAELPGLLRKRVKFVIADPAQIGRAVRAYYPAPAGYAESD